EFLTFMGQVFDELMKAVITRERRQKSQTQIENARRKLEAAIVHGGIAQPYQRVEQAPCAGPREIGALCHLGHAQRARSAVERRDDMQPLGERLHEFVAALEGTQARGLSSISHDSVPPCSVNEQFDVHRLIWCCSIVG